MGASSIGENWRHSGSGLGPGETPNLACHVRFVGSLLNVVTATAWWAHAPGNGHAVKPYDTPGTVIEFKSR